MIDRDDSILMLDTETANDIDCPLVYDVGYQIFSLNDGVKCERSFVNADIFDDEQLMNSAYFKEKIPQYIKDIADGKRKIAPWAYIKKVIASDCKKYGVKYACAHNAAFDNRALNVTQRYQTTSKHRYFLPFGIKWLDTLKMARSVLSQMPTYRRFCEENGYITKNNQCRYTAEIIYRYITKDNNFIESHTGLEDVEIEAQIFAYCVRQHKKMEKLLWES